MNKPFGAWLRVGGRWGTPLVGARWLVKGRGAKKAEGWGGFNAVVTIMREGESRAVDTRYSHIKRRRVLEMLIASHTTPMFIDEVGGSMSVDVSYCNTPYFLNIINLIIIFQKELIFLLLNI
nr:hypothetical protein Iba_chr13bCG12490 [Ipomoea batatas]